MAESIHLTATIPTDYANHRLDQALALLFPAYSRARLQQWIKEGSVTVNGITCKPKDKVHGGEHIVISTTLAAQISWDAEAITLDIIYEDDDLFIVNKPSGLVTHPAVGNPCHTLVNALLYHVPQLEQLPRAGIIHRLDKDTSGLLVVAKTLPAHAFLVNEMQTRRIHREYQGIVNGVLISGGTIDAPIGRHPVQRKQMTIMESGKPARTHYRVIERYRMHTLIQVQLDTGRTHQIRVHMASIKHPLLGDKMYGARVLIPKNAELALQDVLRGFKHQALHAYRLVLQHPRLNKTVECVAPLPNEIQKLIELLRQNES